MSQVLHPGAILIIIMIAIISLIMTIQVWVSVRTQDRAAFRPASPQVVGMWTATKLMVRRRQKQRWCQGCVGILPDKITPNKEPKEFADGAVTWRIWVVNRIRLKLSWNPITIANYIDLNRLSPFWFSLTTHTPAKTVKRSLISQHDSRLFVNRSTQVCSNQCSLVYCF